MIEFTILKSEEIDWDNLIIIGKDVIGNLWDTKGNCFDIPP